jgi:long-chain acyl-CoA synthetase
MAASRTILITGATGLLGRVALQRLLADNAGLHAMVLVRDADRFARLAGDSGSLDRMTVVQGDLRSPELGLTSEARARVRREVSAIVHLAADTRFSNSLANARAVNTTGTKELLALAADCKSNTRFAYVSTAFVAGRRTGVIAEALASTSDGWVNAYEQSKYEAEQLVCRGSSDWVILRPSTVVCDDRDGALSQLNAVHRALRLYRAGLVAMMPGIDASTLDVVTTDFVASAIAQLALRDDAARTVVHLCAGKGAMPLGELLDLTYDYWAHDPEWRRRGIERPPLVDLATYALFERSIEEVGDASIKRLTRSLSHFVPQLALPKVFDTSTASALLGVGAQPVREFWLSMLERLFPRGQAAVDASRAA